MSSTSPRSQARTRVLCGSPSRPSSTTTRNRVPSSSATNFILWCRVIFRSRSTPNNSRRWLMPYVMLATLCLNLSLFSTCFGA
uniref:Uncharacterized protein n=1 Tax=Arundo donax TaxID=35708 RepID=A0A0A9BF61_ARUDO